MRRGRAVLHVGASDLATLLNLPGDVEITGYAVDPIRDTIALRVESDRFAHVPECHEPPQLPARVAVLTAADGVKIRHTTWPGLEKAGYEIEYRLPADDEAEEQVQ